MKGGPSRPMNQKARMTNAASARLAMGESVILRDVNGNTEQVIKALNDMISDKSGNSATGAAYLRELVLHDPADKMLEYKVANARKMFDPELNISLMRAAQLPPDMRGRPEMRTIDRHLGWHPFFSSVRGYLKQKLYRNIRLVSPRLGEVVVLQGDLADSVFVGRVEHKRVLPRVSPSSARILKRGAPPAPRGGSRGWRLESRGCPLSGRSSLLEASTEGSAGVSRHV